MISSTLVTVAFGMYGWGQYMCWSESRVGLSGLATDQSTFHEKLKFRLAMYNLREVVLRIFCVREREHLWFSWRQERDIKPAAFGKLVSSLLYEKRFGPYFIEPVIAGLGEVLISDLASSSQNLIVFEIRTINPTFSRAISLGRPWFQTWIRMASLWRVPVPSNCLVCASLCGVQVRWKLMVFLHQCLWRQRLLGMEPEELFETISQCLLAGKIVSGCYFQFTLSQFDSLQDSTETVSVAGEPTSISCTACSDFSYIPQLWMKLVDCFDFSLADVRTRSSLGLWEAVWIELVLPCWMKTFSSRLWLDVDVDLLEGLAHSRRYSSWSADWWIL